MSKLLQITNITTTTLKGVLAHGSGNKNKNNSYGFNFHTARFDRIDGAVINARISGLAYAG